MGLTNEQLKELKEMLLVMKKDLEERADSHEEPSGSDELTVVDNHLTDSAHGVVNREEQQAEGRLVQQRLKDVKEALERMKNGTYGVCVDTGEAIPFERLKAVPYAKRTVEAEAALQDGTEAGDRGPTSRMEVPDEETEDARRRTVERLEEEHNRVERPEDFEEENKW